MARKVPGFAHGTERKFLPESFENRSDEEPITVWIKTPTEREKREVMSTAAATVETTKNGDAVLDEWNIEDSEGNPLPCNGKGMNLVPVTLANAILAEWSEVAVQASSPLENN